MSLTPQQKKFIEYYVESGKQRQSAVKAGYAPKNASKAAGLMLKHNKEVIAAIEEARAKRADPTAYDLAAAMTETDQAISMAKSTGNATAYLAGIKQKAMLMKLLDDRPASAAFQINISGIGDGEKTVISVRQPSVGLLTGDGEDES